MELLRTIVQHAGICDGNLEEGSLRADANISIRPKGQAAYGTRTEVKNLNSFRSLEKAIEVEVERQKQIILSGGSVLQETRNFDEATQTTTSLRSKTDAHDYRYFPEPDLPPLILKESYLLEIKENLPEHPEEKLRRYTQEYALSDFDCKVLMGDVDADFYFRETVAIHPDLNPKEICNWVIGDVTARLKESKTSFLETKITPDYLSKLIQLIQKGSISGKMAKDMLVEIEKTGENPETLLLKMGGGQISDESALIAVIDRILKANEEVVLKVKSGKTNSADFLIGQVMKETKGKAKPDLLRTLIFKQIDAI
jgi:aspartyl-tRNA(Asn)/glutamyl-tRNA(Gln) amidotransferase subunit B